MTHINESNLLKLQTYWEEKIKNHVGADAIQDRSGYWVNRVTENELIFIKEFHPKIDDILRIINNYFCIDHPE